MVFYFCHVVIIMSVKNIKWRSKALWNLDMTKWLQFLVEVCICPSWIGIELISSNKWRLIPHLEPTSSKMKEGFALEINGVVYGNNNKYSRHFACHYHIGSEPEIHSLPMEGGGGIFEGTFFWKPNVWRVFW